MRNTIQLKNNNIIKSEDISFIILTATNGKNIKYPRCNVTFKDEETLLQKQVKTILSVFPHADIIVVCGEDAESIYRKNKIKNVRYVENQIYNNSGQCKSLFLGMIASKSDNIVVISGDIYFSAADIALINKKQSSLFVKKDKIDNDTKIGVVIDDNKVSTISYNLPNRWNEITVFTGYELEELKELLNNKIKHNWFVYETINFILNKRGEFYTKFSNIIEINTNKDIERINKCLS